MAKKSNIAAIIAVLLVILSLFILPNLFTENIEEDEQLEELVLDESYYSKYKGQNKSVIVYNWGEYISDGSDNTLDVNKAFTDATGIKVNYLTFATNEELYAKLKSGNAGYDIIIPSDYMIGRMISEKMIQPLNYDLLPNVKNISPQFLESGYDNHNVYSMPYTWGITGIIYNNSLLNAGDVVDSWDILWDEDYAGEILMFSNPRDAFSIAQKKLGYSLNSENPKELKDSLEELKKQKPLVQAYVMDEIFDKMIASEATLAPYYAGDALTMIEDNPNLDFAVPKEGTNIFVDAAAIPVNAPNPELAHMYLNFLMEGQVAAANSEFIGYATPNESAKEHMDAETLENPIAYPPVEVIENTEYFLVQTREMSLLMDDYWTDLLSSDQEYSRLFVPILLIIAIIATIGINTYRAHSKRKKQHYV